jgi:peptidoglycan/xylan/chitin deacetylase (PgdA/CDA1 family)
MLTFDLDGVSSWLRRNPDFRFLPSLMSMAEYGPSVATPRILDMLDAHGIKATFFVPGYVAESHAELVKDIVRRGHEVGHHGYLHESPATLSSREEQSVLEKGTDILTRITGQAPRGYRAPGWELSERSAGLLASHGFIYDSSLMGDDAPYLLNRDTAQQLVEIPVHWLLDDAPHFVYAPAANRLGPMRSPDEVYSAWAAEFDGLYHYGRAFTLTMHPQHIGRPGRLMMLDRLVRYIRGFPHVEFMRAVDVAQLWKAPAAPPPSPKPAPEAPAAPPQLGTVTGGAPV